MKVNDFINEYKSKSDREKDMFIKKHIIREYLPYEDKIAACEGIIKQSMYTTIDEREVFSVNSPIKYMLYICAIVREYTDLEMNPDNMLADFNMLEKYNISTFLVNNIIDISNFSKVLLMIEDDTLSKERDVIGYIDRMLNDLRLVLNEFRPDHLTED